MIHEVDESLRLLMRREALQGADVEILFEAPTKDWAGRRNTPTIDVYLYDIREELRQRHQGMIDVRGDDGRVVERRMPPRFFKLSYLVTAWTQRPEDEHRLLSAVLGAFLKYDAVPEDLLIGSLAEVGFPTMCSVALPPPQDRSIGDIWSALGGELKPSLELVVTAPAQTGATFHAGPPVVEAPIVGFRPPSQDDPVRTRGRLSHRRLQQQQGGGSLSASSVGRRGARPGQGGQGTDVFAGRGGATPDPRRRSRPGAPAVGEGKDGGTAPTSTARSRRRKGEVPAALTHPDGRPFSAEEVAAAKAAVEAEGLVWDEETGTGHPPEEAWVGDAHDDPDDHEIAELQEEVLLTTEDGAGRVFRVRSMPQVRRGRR